MDKLALGVKKRERVREVGQAEDGFERLQVHLDQMTRDAVEALKAMQAIRKRGKDRNRGKGQVLPRLIKNAEDRQDGRMAEERGLCDRGPQQIHNTRSSRLGVRFSKGLLIKDKQRDCASSEYATIRAKSNQSRTSMCATTTATWATARITLWHGREDLPKSEWPSRPDLWPHIIVLGNAVAHVSPRHPTAGDVCPPLRLRC